MNKVNEVKQKQLDNLCEKYKFLVLFLQLFCKSKNKFKKFNKPVRLSTSNLTTNQNKLAYSLKKDNKI